jgi:cell division protein FtsB
MVFFVPGGVELAVILLVFLLLFAPAILAIVAGLYLYRQRTDRIEELEAEIEELRKRVEGDSHRES